MAGLDSKEEIIKHSQEMKKVNYKEDIWSMGGVFNNDEYDNPENHKEYKQIQNFDFPRLTKT